MNANAPSPSFALSMHSAGNLIGVVKSLEQLVTETAKASPIPFIVSEGLRLPPQQLKDWLAGKSRFNGIPKGKSEFGFAGTGESKHQFGKAVDLIPLVGGMPSWEWHHYYILFDAVRKVAIDLNTRVIWGGCWAEPLNTLPPGPAGLNLAHLRYCKQHPTGLVDGPHLELES